MCTCSKRAETVDFYRQLGMHALRHEEFTEGCEAQCNGPYSGHWSKSMIGYGPEDDHFVTELTYNYGVRIVPFLTRKWSFYFDLNVPILTIPIFHLTKAASSDYVQSKSEKLITLQSPCGEKDSPNENIQISRNIQTSSMSK